MLIITKLYCSLTIFQQSHYNIKSYLKYYLNNLFFYFIIPLYLSLFYFISPYLFIILDIYSLLFLHLKVKLKPTKRIIKNVILFILILPLLLIPYSFFIFIFLEILIIPIYLLEEVIELPKKRKILVKAKNTLLEYKGNIIGITGSAGKTTAKNFFSIIFNAYKTPKSYNTPLGIANSINNTTIINYDYLILEMGVAKKGDMEELLALVKPNIMVLTNILPMHIDGLGSIDGVYKEKLKAFRDCDISICNYESEYIRNHFSNPTITYGFDYGMYQARNINNNTFDLYYNDTFLMNINSNCSSKLEILDLLAPLGLYHYLGYDLSLLKLKLLNLPHEKNRIEIKGNDKHIIYDDSYNSNIDGFKEALRISYRKDIRNFIITPGIVELGKYKTNINKIISFEIASYCDDVILVGGLEVLDLYYEIKKYQIRVYRANSFKEGYKIYKRLIKKLDSSVLLIENDLPDIYRRRLFI